MHELPQASVFGPQVPHDGSGLGVGEGEGDGLGDGEGVGDGAGDGGSTAQDEPFVTGLPLQHEYSAELMHESPQASVLAPQVTHDGSGLGVGEGAGAGDGLGEGDGEGDGDGDGAGEGVGDGDGLGDGEGEGLGGGRGLLITGSISSKIFVLFLFWLFGLVNNQ